MHSFEKYIFAGTIVLPDGTVVPDASSYRIDDLCEHYLQRLGALLGGASVLYRDPADNRLWERVVRTSRIDGAKSAFMQALTESEAIRKYGDEVVNGSSHRDL
ncbi:MAG: hypothetical protein GC200_06130 [Tepidisphaera sp.]|nr:hypothetical protein [Tepidisphaera sp.]